jgi:hypothetical protein
MTGSSPIRILTGEDHPDMYAPTRARAASDGQPQIPRQTFISSR